MRVYLAGKMGGRSGHDVLNERIHAARVCDEAGIDYIDPARGENVDPWKVVDLGMSFDTMRRFVSKDEWAIRNCDALLVLTGDTPSEGTGWEMGLAFFELHIPIVMVSPLRVKGKLMGFSNIKVDAIFETVEEAVEYIAENYGRV